jgi:hypothetical protein
MANEQQLSNGWIALAAKRLASIIGSSDQRVIGSAEVLAAQISSRFSQMSAAWSRNQKPIIHHGDAETRRKAFRKTTPTPKTEKSWRARIGETLNFYAGQSWRILGPKFYGCNSATLVHNSLNPWPILPCLVIEKEKLHGYKSSSRAV